MTSDFRFSQRSRERLMDVHPALSRLAHRALELSTIDFTVTEGRRTLERQRQLVAKGASQTLKSRHLTGHAIDVAAVIDGEIRWDWPLYAKIAAAFRLASVELDIPIVWGGSWKSLRDGPHFELDRRAYP